MTKKKHNGDGFVEITNKDIYDKICQLEEHVKETNGKVKRSMWMASTGLGLFTVILVLLVQHISK